VARRAAGAWRRCAARDRAAPRWWTAFEAPTAARGARGRLRGREGGPGHAGAARALQSAPASRAPACSTSVAGPVCWRDARWRPARGAVVAVDDDLAAVRSAEPQPGRRPARARAPRRPARRGWGRSGSTRSGATRPSTSGGRWWAPVARVRGRRARRAAPGGRGLVRGEPGAALRGGARGWAAWGDATPAGERTFKVLWARRAL
jgi:hypothetical protein